MVIEEVAENEGLKAPVESSRGLAIKSTSGQ